MSTEGPEIIVGIVGAAGCDLRLVIDTLKSAFADVAYDVQEIRLSQLLRAFEDYKDLPKPGDDYEDYVEKHMSAGDDLCGKTSADFIARLAITEIRLRRREHNVHLPEDKRDDTPVPRTAYVLNSLKRPAEVSLLREVYGNSFILISASPRGKTAQIHSRYGLHGRALRIHSSAVPPPNA